MAGFVDRIKSMWDAPDDEFEEEDRDDIDRNRERSRERERARDRYDDEYDSSYRRSTRTRSDYSRDDYSSEPVRERQNRRNNNVVNISATAKLQVAIFKPERFGEETRNIADELIKTHTVVLNLEDTNKDMARRIIDFLSGVTYANRGKIKKVANSTFLITPNNVDLTGDDLLDELEHSGVYF